MTDPMAAVAAIRERLLGPGGEFELAEQDVRGVPLPVFVNRRPALREWLVDSARHGDVEYLVQGERRLTFAQHLSAVATLADVLATEHGVRRDDRVAILAANSPDWVVAFWACVSLGAVAVAGNAWWTAHEARHAFEQVTPTLVIADDRRAGLVGSIPVLRIEDVPARTARHTADLPDVTVDAESPAVVMYTSGTSGHPKGAVHSHGNLLSLVEYHRWTDAMASASAEVFGLPSITRPRRFLMSLPLFHIASLHNLAIPRLTSGDTVVIDAGRFDVERVLGVIERERVTNWAIVPTMAARLVAYEQLDDRDLSTLRALSINSAPSSAALKDKVRDAIPGVAAALADSYGMTEICTAATVATPADLAAYPDTVGAAIPSVQVQIRVDGEVVDDGVEGEIWTRSQFVMLGYWDDLDATSAMVTDDGWVRTGDLGSLRDGRLFMASRRLDLILRGGENVYPAEVEAVLGEHPDVEECAVYGVADDDLGQAVAALVVADPALEPDLRVLAAERLAYYKVPSVWRFTRTPLARTATGKVIRRGLADRSRT